MNKPKTRKEAKKKIEEKKTQAKSGKKTDLPVSTLEHETTRRKTRKGGGETRRGFSLASPMDELCVGLL